MNEFTPIFMVDGIGYTHPDYQNDDDDIMHVNVRFMLDLVDNDHDKYNNVCPVCFKINSIYSAKGTTWKKVMSHESPPFQS